MNAIFPASAQRPGTVVRFAPEAPRTVTSRRGTRTIDETGQGAPRAAPEGELDRSTLERCKLGDPLAFRAFVVRYERLVFAILSRMLGRGPLVEDLAQETFLRAFRAFPRFDLDLRARPSTWLVTIATRLALGERRREASHKTFADDEVDAVDYRAPEARAEQRELGAAIEAAAAELSPEQRAVFVLAELHGYPLAEIATMVEIPEATVKTRLFRARAKMRERLAPFADELTFGEDEP